MATKEIKEEKPRETIVEFLASLAGVLVTGLFIITFILQAFEIPSASMENTLLIGDHVFVNRVQFAPPGGMQWVDFGLRMGDPTGIWWWNSRFGRLRTR